MYMYVAFYKPVYRHPLKEIDDFNVILFQVYYGVCIQIIIAI